MAIFWIQSAFIGLFNVIGILSFTNRIEDSYTVNDKLGNKPGCAALFFTVHYGAFHLAYLFYVGYKLSKAQHIDWLLIQLSFWTILFSSILQFIQDKRHNQTEAVNIGTMFFMPYARIFPMHLAILLPAFLHIHVGIVFLALKMVADIIMHVVYRKFMFKQVEAKGTTGYNS